MSELGLSNTNCMSAIPSNQLQGLARLTMACVFLFIFNCHSVDAASQDSKVTVVESVPTGSMEPLYTANRSPLSPSPLIKLPIGSITPKGWLRHQLELEAKGMTGRLPELSKWCK